MKKQSYYYADYTYYNYQSGNVFIVVFHYADSDILTGKPMYKPNYNFFFKINNRWLRYISLFLIIFFFLFSSFNLFAQDMNGLQSMDSNSNLDDEQLPESSITTKIYRSTDNSGEILPEAEAELDPTSGVDVINKDELVGKQSDSMNKILHRKKINNKAAIKKSLDNTWIPWVLFVVILGLLFALIKAIKKIKI
ncbi:MAG: hypothetical protein A3F80_08290 [Candidatus Melainabacteria bacterium RIFCSPLOWO2_12_FULL_35_11]|nr:MAG: hypothetical protein A3F80_08290 [Candidatus Melainabacteria bacterium RIFCSPLOWO2_12_FULL_35_11]